MTRDQTKKKTGKNNTYQQWFHLQQSCLILQETRTFVHFREIKS